MKPGSYLVNTARGASSTSIGPGGSSSDRLAGVGLDVLSVEPIEPPTIRCFPIRA